MPKFQNSDQTNRCGTGSWLVSKRTAAIPRFLTRIRVFLPRTTNGKRTRIRRCNLLQDNILCGDGLLASTIEIYMGIVESSRANLRKKTVRNRQLSHKILKLNWLHVEIFFFGLRRSPWPLFYQKKSLDSVGLRNLPRKQHVSEILWPRAVMTKENGQLVAHFLLISMCSANADRSPL